VGSHRDAAFAPISAKLTFGEGDNHRVAFEKPTGLEVYQVLTKRSGLRILLKEEFPNAAVTELVEVKDQ